MTNHVEQFIVAVRTKARQDETYAVATQKSILKLILLLEGTKDQPGLLKDKKNRLPFLQAITGIPLNSTKQLTQWYVSTLIDEVINAKPNVIHEIEGLLESISGREGNPPWNLMEWEKPEVNVSILQNEF
jgi:hypothetical protein